MGGCRDSRVVRQRKVRLKLHPILPLHHGTSQAATRRWLAFDSAATTTAEEGRVRRSLCPTVGRNRRGSNATALIHGNTLTGSAVIYNPEQHGSVLHLLHD